MKKILSKGSTSKYRARCPFCDCEFEYQLDDVYTYQTVMQYSRNRFVDCPCCNMVLYHSENASTRISTESL